MGLSLDEISQLLQTGGEGECRRVRDLLQTKLTELDTRMKAMREFRRTLVGQLAACENELSSHGQEAKCPVMANITHLDHSPRHSSKSKEKRK